MSSSVQTPPREEGSGAEAGGGHGHDPQQGGPGAPLLTPGRELHLSTGRLSRMYIKRDTLEAFANFVVLGSFLVTVLWVGGLYTVQYDCTSAKSYLLSNHEIFHTAKFTI